MKHCWAALKTIGDGKSFTCKTSFENPSLIWDAWGLKTLSIVILMLLPCYFSTGCCSPVELPPIMSGKRKSIKLSCRDGIDSIPNASLQERCKDKICQKAHHHAGIIETSNMQVPCVKGFLSLWLLSSCSVFHCSPWMSVTFCCPIKGIRYLEWADGSQWDCRPFPLQKGPCVNT